jgi:hypothetical protein
MSSFTVPNKNFIDSAFGILGVEETEVFLCDNFQEEFGK